MKLSIPLFGTYYLPFCHQTPLLFAKWTSNWRAISVLFNPTYAIFLCCVKWDQMPTYFLLSSIAVIGQRSMLREDHMRHFASQPKASWGGWKSWSKSKSLAHRYNPPQQRSKTDLKFLNQGLDCHCHLLKFHCHREIIT